MSKLDLNRINDMESGVLGKTTGSIALESSLEHKVVSMSLMDQAKRSIDILTYDLEPKIYDNREMYNRFRQFAIRNRHSHIRILIHDAKPVVQKGHILIDIIQRLTSSIEVKRLSIQDRQLTNGYLIADKTGYVIRPEITRFEGRVEFNNRYTARELSDEFESAWLHADPEPELRRLHL